MNIVIVGPHPDDQELAMGGTIALLAGQGHAVTLVDMTNGEPTPFGDPVTRGRESQSAADVLGVKRIQAGFKNREVVHSIEGRHRIAELYRQIRPDLIFLPYPADAHPDHLATTRICEDARFDAKLTKTQLAGEPIYPRRILYYFCSHLRFNFPASFVIDISSTYAKKLAAINCYQSQFYTGRTGQESGAVVRYVETISKYFGGTINTAYGEPFWSQEMMGLAGLGQLVV